MKKVLTGIEGFDKVTLGGLPAGRPTLIAGGPGCGKSLFALSCIAHSVAEQDGGAVFLSFEEQVDDIIINARSIGLNLDVLIEEKKLLLDHVPAPSHDMVEVGQYNLDGLLLRIASLIAEVDARIIAIDTIETLFTMFDNQKIIRSELVKLFNWFKRRGVTLLITGEQGAGSITRYGLEEYVSDCVLYLDHRVDGDVSTRRLRIVKYRGAKHGTNEFPFVIDSDGIHVMPVTVAELNHTMPSGYISSGFERLDQALGDDGFRKGSTILLSGVTGTGKTNMLLTMAGAAAARGIKVLFFSFEESPDEIVNNVASIGVDIQPYLDDGSLVLKCARPTLQGLEQHLVEMYRLLEQEEPRLVCADPLTGLKAAGTQSAVYRTMVRLVDALKQRQMTFIASANHNSREDDTGLDISAIIDVWLQLRRCDHKDEFEKTIEIVKARGVKHEIGRIGYAITSSGIRFDTPIANVGLGPIADV